MLFPWRIDSKPLLTNEMIGKSKPVLNDLGFLPLAAEAFLDMRSDAEKDGIGISLVSVYRSFSAQMNIWNKKYMALSLEPEKRIRQIIRYTAIPGTSRHHWGTDADLIDAKKPIVKEPLSEKHFTEGVYADMYGWLKKNANKYGFFEVYDSNPKRTGFAYEPWHWSFAGLSIPILRDFLHIDINEIRDSAIYGSEYFTDDFLFEYK